MSNRLDNLRRKLHQHCLDLKEENAQPRNQKNGSEYKHVVILEIIKTKQEIRRLEKQITEDNKIVNKNGCIKITDKSDTKMYCSICMEIKKKSQCIRYSYCRHEFCAECNDIWHESCSKSWRAVHCPLCRNDYFTVQKYELKKPAPKLPPKPPKKTYLRASIW